METVVGLFRTYEEAEVAVDALGEAGFADNLSVLAQEQVVVESLDADGLEERVDRAGAETQGLEEEGVNRAGAGALGGAVVGGLAGLLIGVGALILPGLGTVLAAGSIAGAITATAAGAAAGGFLGALVGFGVPEEDAHAFAEGVKRGGILVVAHATDGRGEIAQTIMNNAGAVDIEESTAEWRAGGWNQFDETQNPGLEAGAWGRLQKDR